MLRINKIESDRFDKYLSDYHNKRECASAASQTKSNRSARLRFSFQVLHLYSSLIKTSTPRTRMTSPCYCLAMWNVHGHLGARVTWLSPHTTRHILFQSPRSSIWVHEMNLCAELNSKMFLQADNILNTVTLLATHWKASKESCSDKLEQTPRAHHHSDR